MDHVFYFKDLFDSFPDYSKVVVLIMSSIRNDVELLQECGYLKDDINRLCL